MTNTNCTIDFNRFRSLESRVFSGRDRAGLIRKEIDFDKLLTNCESIQISIPDDIYSINTSFFLGLFGSTVRRLGEEKFRKRFKFICSETIKNDLEEGIDRALKEKSVI